MCFSRTIFALAILITVMACIGLQPSQAVPNTLATPIPPSSISSSDWHWWDLVESLSIAAAAIAAIAGINAWRVQLKGTKEHDLAEQTLTLFYEARDMIRAIRSPLGWSGEGSIRKAPEGEDPELKAIRDNAYIGYERYQTRQECFNKLHALRYRFMAIFGKNKVQPFDDIHKVVNEIILAYRHIGRLKEVISRRSMPSAREGSYFEKIDKAEETIWEGLAEKDVIQERVNNAVERIERHCERILRGKTRFWSFSTGTTEDKNPAQ